MVFALLALTELGSPTADHAVAVITITVVLSVVVHGATADPLAIRHARMLGRQADGHAVAEVPAYRSADSSLLKAGMPCDLGSEVVAPLWLMIEPTADEGLDVRGVAQRLQLTHAIRIACLAQRRRRGRSGGLPSAAGLAGPESVAGRLTSTRR